MRQVFLSLLIFWKIFGKWIVLFCSGWLGLWWRRWRRSARRTRMEGWPSVTGRILYGNVAPVPKTTKSLATLTYSYFVDEFRSGTYDIEFNREAEADEFIRDLKDREVQVRYKASQPDTSCPELAHVEQMAAAITPLSPKGSLLNRFIHRFLPDR